MIRAGAAMALSAGMLLACVSADPAGVRAPAPEPEREPAEEAASITVTGRVTVTGSEPHVQLVIVTGKETYELVGTAAETLLGLQQRRVTVRGRVVREAAGPGFPAQLRVESYAVKRAADA